MGASIDLSRWIKRGDRVAAGQGAAEPAALTTALRGQVQEIGPVTIVLGNCFSDWPVADLPQELQVIALSGTGAAGGLLQAGRADLLAVPLSDLAGLVRNNRLGVDVVLVQLARDPRNPRRYSLGPGVDVLPEMMGRARVVCAQINGSAPFTHGTATLAEADLSTMIEVDDPLPVPAGRIGEVEQAIAGHVAKLVPDRATLHLGLGGVPEAAARCLVTRRDLGLHSGMFGDAAALLLTTGAVTNRFKGIDEECAVASAVLGSRETYRLVHDNRAVAVRGYAYTHEARILAHLYRFFAINSALEVDLTGQVNSERVGGRYIGGVGGASDFARGARASMEGLSIVALPSTGQGGTVSRIVAALSGPATIARTDVDCVVTEHGIADLRGLTVAERSRALTRIADPRFRHQLERDCDAGWAERAPGRVA